MTEIVIRTSPDNRELLEALRGALEDGDTLNVVRSQGFDHAAELISVVVPLTTLVVSVLRDYIKSWTAVRIAETEASRDVNVAQVKANMVLHWARQQVSLVDSSPQKLNSLVVELEAAVKDVKSLPKGSKPVKKAAKGKKSTQEKT